MNQKINALVFTVPLLVSLSCAQIKELTLEETSVPVEVEPEAPKPGDMVLIPAGEFIMGTNEKFPGRPPFERPERKVDLPSFKIDVYEVTHGQWMKFTTISDYKPQGSWRLFYSIGKEDFPVTNVTLDDAKAYCKWSGKRLPTEEEWEKAARGPDGNKYPWGNEFDPYGSNCNEAGYRNTLEVGQIQLDKSPYDVYDMMGNVQEWTSNKLKPYPRSPARGRKEFRRGYYVVRGSSYAMKGGSMGLYTRSAFFPKSQYGIGFRCVQDIEEEAPVMSEN
tara:strand:+ start:370 stop:1200 length:831 start_codon:yes stop_codon:yes gene_type:complete